MPKEPQTPTHQERAAERWPPGANASPPPATVERSPCLPGFEVPPATLREAVERVRQA